MTSEWKETTIGEISDSCLGKMLDQKKNKGTYQPYLANVNVRWGSFDLANLPLMRFEEYEQDRYGIKYGDIILCEGGEPGRCAIWKDQLPNMKIQKALHRIRTHEDVNNEYLFYWFLLAGKTGILQSYFTGSTIQHLPGDKLKSVRLKIPPLDYQEKVASILSCIDEKIEANIAINDNLQEQAFAVYRSWFIDLDPFGGIAPASWACDSLGNICSCVLGGTPSRAKPEYWDGNIPWINSGEVNNFRITKPSERITELGLRKSATKLLPSKTTVIAITGATLGQVSLLEIDACANQSVVGVLPNDKLPYEFLYPYINANIQELITHQTGGAQQHINKQNVESMQVTIPTAQALTEYIKVVRGMYEMIANNCFEIEYLIQLRDALLPRLISGEIDVSKITL